MANPTPPPGFQPVATPPAGFTPAQEQSSGTRWMPTADDWTNLAKNLYDGFKQPGYSAEQALMHVANALGVKSVPGIGSLDQFQQDQRQRQATWDAQAQKTWGGKAVQGAGAVVATLPGLAMAPASLAAVPITGAVTALAQPQREDGSNYAGQVTRSALQGASANMAVPVVGKAVGGIIQGAKNFGATKSPGEMLDQLGAKLGGKSPGEALQAAAKQKYDAAWDEFGKAIAPVDQQAGGAQMDYSPAISKLEQVLGVGQKQAPMAMPDERRKVLMNLLGDLKEASNPQGGIDNSFAGAMGVVKRLGAEQRRLAVAHGDTEAREMLGDVRDAVLQSMEKSNPALSQAAADARGVFRDKVAPLFDKSEGGNYLTQIRDSATPGDLLVSGNQGALTRMKPDKAAIIAKGSSADPMLYSYLDAAINQAKGNPRAFADSLKKAMPAIEAISDPATLQAFQGMVKVADSAKTTGTLANLGLAAIPGYHEAGATMGLALNFKPAMTGPGLVWKLLQSPATRKILSGAASLPADSPALEAVATNLTKAAGFAPRWWQQPATALTQPSFGVTP